MRREQDSKTELPTTPSARVYNGLAGIYGAARRMVFGARGKTVREAARSGGGPDDPRLSTAPARVITPFSALERNHLFLSAAGAQFEDASGISGADSIADGRAVGIWDYNRDGWADLAVVNANTPSLEIFRNRIGEQGRGFAAERQFLALRFVGGNHTSKPSPQGTRDGYGALATVALADATLQREHRAGEGLASQNSSTMIIGIGERDAAESVSVRWPSGQVHEAGRVPAGTLITAYEDPSQSPTGSAFVFEPYVVPSASREVTRSADPDDSLHITGADPDGVNPELTMYTTVATWCTICKGELPQVKMLRDVFAADELAVLGIPGDEAESREMWDSYLEEYKPAYRLLTDVRADELTLVKEIVTRELGFDGLPATIVVDGSGRILHAQWGVPSVSKLRGLQAETGRSPRPGGF